ncbi:Nop14-like protein [Westerdykella ornata]|uniref:Nop14-like protein n=1 Tax=Westerdykella ornata TaxID=318751 RepID=A0A6A6JYQ1_WESOR|nr:Nop14-like protein [Westerdykella ornata]KAF2281354.1 Nop14-like protein [Westerdykella ornata]
MPPSQLKRLKASLREQGIVGPQKSKKQKKNQKPNADQRAQKAAALASIREAANPFDFRALARPKKFDYVTNRPEDANRPLGRPGVSKSMGEETRRKTLLPEMNKRNKVGGILDRRIGEDDPSMSLDARMQARFEREQQRKRRGNVFDLEEAEDDVELTHGGKSLRFDVNGEEDYDAASVDAGSDDDQEDGFLRRKRRRDSDAAEDLADGPAQEQPERKKSKKEVMEEIIAKSKQHKYERQQQKEDDEELIEELNKDLPDILAALRGHTTKREQPKEPANGGPADDFGINPERAALIAGKSRDAADKEYDARVRQMLFDQRAKPTERTKTEEEMAKENAERLKELEEQRMRRMRGEESDEEDNKAQDGGDDDQDYGVHDDAAEFGLPSGHTQGSRPEGVEDEDDFLMDGDIIASDSEADMSQETDDESEVDDTMAVEEDEDFLKDVLEQPKTEKAANGVLSIAEPSSKLAYTYPCPRSHTELLSVYKDVAPKDVPVVTQRIRALYHAGLHTDNKNKLADFGCALVDHISYLANHSPETPLTVTETLIRHIHSLSRSYPVQIATRFRAHLKQIQERNDLSPGDLTILTAISSIFPTSDKFSPVVTPALTIIARFLGLNSPSSAKDITTGAYLGALCAERYIPLSKRYIPELIRYTVLCLESPHINSSLISAHTKNLLALADLWSSTPAFIEIFSPVVPTLSALKQTLAVQRLQILLQNARLHRRPQELHHHRPLPIKTSIPKFEEGFDPNKHYDPDKERAEANRLRKEYKRERKGALRELRKDANFIAREKLKEKKERDRRYEEKYKKLVAEIQGEEGREANAYEREKRTRKRKN